MQERGAGDAAAAQWETGTPGAQQKNEGAMRWEGAARRDRSDTEAARGSTTAHMTGARQGRDREAEIMSHSWKTSDA